ncbi:MAG: ADP-forming succinate--CoA ligase subunit beta [Nitrospinota bacterium]|nr:ADP-forming succinate--CoA ligase subunit beta [Nitrospinota bacterium]HJM43349.1 ADP-forming succinate--CoA ligase subunit beta [Nitrospinota bacterium]
MKIHEYQGKEILKSFGIPVPEGGVAETPADAKTIAERLKGRVIVKAQIHAGGRGKGGGVKLADTPADAEEAARRILGMQLVTPQTGPEGQKVKRVLVEEATPIAKELYLGVVIDRARAAPVVMASEAGGMDIEEVAAKTPEKILTEAADPGLGLQAFQARRLAFGLGLPKEALGAASEFFRNLYRVFQDKDCSLAEINPMALMEDGRLLALDAKLNFDDNALYRHADVAGLRDLDEEAPLEVEAAKHDLNYIKLDGEVGCMVNGAGLAMATMDIVKMAGSSPANFLDVGGGASQEMVENAFRILMDDEAVRAVFINIFGGIMRCDVLAQGVVEAVRKLDVKVPIIIRMEGTNVEEGRKILADSGLNFTVGDDMRDGAQKVIEALKR